ncbi:hypothetical protein J0910_02830 [Nocardiopsis sp. CNT-189]|uniref:hypothetical protein n=1 Tax=Nocardiopsis oceanisediminis TaxID=2816862 RepID=UPI003B39BEE0
MNTQPTPAPAGSPAPIDPRIRAVLTAPKGRRFNHPRRYTRPRPATAPDRPASLRASAHARTDTPPWLARLHAELAPDDAAAPPAPPVRRSAAPPRKPVPQAAPRAPRRPRRWTGPRLPGHETAPYTCTVIGLLFAAYLLGLLG